MKVEVGEKMTWRYCGDCSGGDGRGQGGTEGGRARAHHFDVLSFGALQLPPARQTHREMNNSSSSLTQRPSASSRQVNAFTPPKSKLQQAPRAGGQQSSGAPTQQIKIVKPIGSSGTAYENTAKVSPE